MDNVRQEVHYRLGRNLDNQDEASLRQAMYILTQQTGIYKMSAMDSCIYNLRYMTDELKPEDVRKLSKMQVLVRKFAVTSLKKKFRRVGIVESSVKYKKSVFVFLKCFEELMDLEILQMIQTQKHENLGKDAKLLHKINQLLTVNMK